MFHASDQAAMIEESHRRSASYGLTPETEADYSPILKADLTCRIEENRGLATYALPVMETLYEQIVNTHSMVVLTDAQGTILQSMGDDDFIEKADRVALCPGVAWSEQSKGTNAIGTAIAEQTPTLVHADQHFLAINHFLTCSAAPIMDHQGKLIGVLDVTGDHRSFHKHTMALVRMSAQMIENQLFSATFQPPGIHRHADGRHCVILDVGTLPVRESQRAVPARAAAVGAADAYLQLIVRHAGIGIV
jgi:transcriptional regulator of acetoin/glycerol metabolism